MATASPKSMSTNNLVTETPFPLWPRAGNLITLRLHTASVSVTPVGDEPGQHIEFADGPGMPSRRYQVPVRGTKFLGTFVTGPGQSTRQLHKLRSPLDSARVDFQSRVVECGQFATCRGAGFERRNDREGFLSVRQI